MYTQPLGQQLLDESNFKSEEYTYHGHWFIREATFGGYRLNLLVKVYR